MIFKPRGDVDIAPAQGMLKPVRASLSAIAGQILFAASYVGGSKRAELRYIRGKIHPASD